MPCPCFSAAKVHPVETSALMHPKSAANAGDDDDKSDGDRKEHKKSKLSMLQLSMLIFTLTCAGPFGIEEAVSSGGVWYTLLGLFVVPIIYAIPQSLMCAELGSMMPSHHGYIIWVPFFVHFVPNKPSSLIL